MNKKTVKSWKKFILNQKGLTVKEYLDFINSVTYSVLTQKDVVYLSDELQMDPINFWT